MPSYLTPATLSIAPESLSSVSLGSTSLTENIYVPALLTVIGSNAASSPFPISIAWYDLPSGIVTVPDLTASPVASSAGERARRYFPSDSSGAFSTIFDAGIAGISVCAENVFTNSNALPSAPDTDAAMLPLPSSVAVTVKRLVAFSSFATPSTVPLSVTIYDRASFLRPSPSGSTPSKSSMVNCLVPGGPRLAKGPVASPVVRSLCLAHLVLTSHPRACS